MRDIYFVANGSTSATKAAYRGGAKIGFEAMNTRPVNNIPIQYVDWPFSKLDNNSLFDVFKEYINTIQTEQPELVVIPDLDGRIPIERVFEWSYKIKEYCDTLIVVPKNVHPSVIPNDLRVGVPCQDKFSDIQWDIDDFRPCKELHLLGGSPHKHYEIIYEEGLHHVESIDTSVPVFSARWGDTWTLKDGEPYWGDGRGGTYGCIEASYRNMNTILNAERDGVTEERLYIERPDWGKYETCGHPDEDLLHPDDEKPFAGREYYTRMTYNTYPET